MKVKKSPKIRPPNDHLTIPEHGSLQQNQMKISNTFQQVNKHRKRDAENSNQWELKNNPWIQKPLHALQHQDNDYASENQKEHSLHLHYGTHTNPNALPTIEDTKPLHRNPNTNTNHENLERHMTLFDLTSLGIGGTIGSGIFVLCGVIANSYAGPATFISWTIAGIAAMLSGASYAELAAHLPAAGSAYVYVYASMGELPAVIVAGCLTLEYVASASAVARSWGEKVVDWLLNDVGLTLDDENSFWSFIVGPLSMSTERMFNPMAFMISTLSVVLLLVGVKESKAVTNFFTMTKVCVVLFMTLGGLFLLEPQNLTPIIPAQFGWSGVFRGATSSFFGYLGFDEICCIAGEAQNPKKNIPYSILLTLVCSMSIYVLAAIALTGMQPYETIDGVQGFPGAFTYNGYTWAAHLTAAGEILTLPIVVLITIMAQPRLQYALAQDGLLPSWFAQLDSTGNLWNGTVSSGIIMILIASFIPFTHLNDMISAGVLVSFSMTSSSLLLLRHDSPPMLKRRTNALRSASSNSLSSMEGNFVDSFLMEKLVAFLNGSAFLSSILITHFLHIFIAKVLAGLLCILMVGCCAVMYLFCPPSSMFGGEKRKRYKGEDGLNVFKEEEESGYFQTPFLPFLPCIAIVINWYLISQLELMGILLLVFFLGGCGVFYFMYGAKHSLLRKYYKVEQQGFMDSFNKHADGTFADDEEYDDERFGTEKSDLLLLRSISLPRVSSKS